MTGIKNRRGNACFLACLESFLQDYSIKVTQEEMVKKLLANNLCRDEVLYILEKRGMFARILEFCLTILRLSSQFQESMSVKAYWLQHIKIRNFTVWGFFKNLTDEEKIIVMDPNFEGNSNLRYMDKKDFFDQDCKLHKICLYK